MNLKKMRYLSNDLIFAESKWRPTKQEKRARLLHDYVENLERVDQMWPWLKAHYGNVLAVDAPHASPPERFNYSELSDLISAAAAGISSFGIGNGDVVAIFSENSPRWLVIDQGIMRVNAIDAVRGASAPIEELRYILEDSKAIGLVIQSADLLHKLELSEEEQRRFKFVLQLEGEATSCATSWEDFLQKGLNKSLNTSTNQIANQILVENTDTAIATILYTSGTTGKPKGVPLSHANLLHQIRSLACVADPSPGAPVLSVLPIWHSYERSAEYYFFSCACSQSYTTIKKLKFDLPRVRPIVMATVPRLWEAIKIGFDDAVKLMPANKQKLIKAALKNSSAYKVALRKTRNLLIYKVSLLKRFQAVLEVVFRFPLHKISALFLWPKVLNQLCGGRLLFPISGGGAIAPHVDLFFESIGLELLVGYGLTETSPVVSCRRPWRNIRGSAGLPLPETEFRIIDQETKVLKNLYEKGLVLVKGPQVMKGYLRRPQETQKVLDAEGWFNTGDLGMLLSDGSLVLTGRCKDTIVLSNGENIEPGPLEECLVASPLIEQVMMVGQDERQLGLLVVPNNEMVLNWAKKNGLFTSGNLLGSSGNKELRTLFRSEINRILSARVGSRSEERVFGVGFVEPFTIENGLLTQTLKQRRDKIYERDESVISMIYER
ncbi:AMP-binding protein [Prochlorococcus sp. MIT 1223]|uniref:AMP-binding protein n=1 Tax=Prochlorococcus sp. MIT 1223 TaxID=3096217 RepID=UPI002A74FF4B|nr:AMP-binding protein [Prochlorococcus sp. MIT 1223]